MFNEFSNQNFQESTGYGMPMSYNNCAIDGNCSIDPIIYSLMEVLLYELKQMTYYYLKMQELGYENQKVKDKIINYLSLVIIGYEFNLEDFESILKELHQEKENVKKSYMNICDKNNLDCQILKSNINFEKFDLYSIVKQGEQQAINRNVLLDVNTKNLYEIILNLIKSAAIRLIELKSYTKDKIEEEDALLKLFNNLNFSSMTELKLIKKVNDFAKENFKIHNKLHNFKEKYFGKISLNKVSTDIQKGKGILVSGQNLKDFENLLEATKDSDINIYTHNGLIVAHAYPKFKEYKNLKGHFQMSLDSVQFDFASFKGPVLVIRNFQYFLDKLYRGRIYTTNMIAGKGMSKIENNDFSNLIEVAQKSQGYEEKIKNPKVNVGYDEKKVFEKVEEVARKIQNGEIKHLLIVGLFNHGTIESEYFKELEKNLPDEYFVISTSIPSNKKNILYFDSFFNSSLIYNFLSALKKRVDIEEFPISLFITSCNMHTLSHLFNLKQLGVKNIYLPKCTTNVITPNMLKFLKEKFDFRQITNNAKEDLKKM